MTPYKSPIEAPFIQFLIQRIDQSTHFRFIGVEGVAFHIYSKVGKLFIKRTSAFKNLVSSSFGVNPGQKSRKEVEKGKIFIYIKNRIIIFQNGALDVRFSQDSLLRSVKVT